MNDFAFITVSSHPKDERDELLGFDVVVNVSDHVDFELNSWLKENKIQSYWFPLGEAYGMPLENIFGAMWVLWHAERLNQKVFLHCMAGRNRSRMILDCYEYMMTGEFKEESSMMLNVKDNQLPGIYRLEVFLEKCLEVFQNPDIADGALIDWVKKETFGF